MAEPPAYILDASVAGKWFLRLADEAHTDIAERVRTDFEQGRIRLLAPDHIRSELGHTFTRAIRRNRMTWDGARTALERFYSFGVELVPHSGILLGGLHVAQRYGCSFSDATYLALAAMTDNPFLHADGKLRDKLAGLFPYELWIENYQR